jgi:hypothetical protein
VVRRPLAKRPVERVELDEDVAHLRDRVDPQVWPRSVRRAAVGLDLEGDESLVGDPDLHLRRFGDDRCIGADALEHRLRADRGQLLVHDRGDDDVAAQPALAGLGGGNQTRGEPALHVVRAPPVQPSVLDARLERVDHPFVSDRVQVRVQEQRPPVA